MKEPSRLIQEFIERQATVPVADVCRTSPDEETSPYASYWYRAVAAMLLSGRVQARDDGWPNRTDVNRICKEANFNQYLFERVGRFLVAADVIRSERRVRQYEPGPHHPEFWDHDLERLQAITRPAVLHLALEPTAFPLPLHTAPAPSRPIEFLTVFFHCSRGLAFREDRVGEALLAFSRLPEQELVRAAKDAGLKVKEHECGGWQRWLKPKGQQALLSALYTAEWAYAAEHRKQYWVFPSATGLAMLGLGPPPRVEPLLSELKVLPNLSVFAGAGRSLEELAVLFRHCRTRRIDRVLELRLDRRRLEESSARTPAAEELGAVFRELGPLPNTVVALLATPSPVGGVLQIRGCSAIVKPPSPEVLEVIRKHPRLKGYLEPKAPPGYLLIKPTSSPHNFIDRCRELGFEIQVL